MDVRLAVLGYLKTCRFEFLFSYLVDLYFFKRKPTRLSCITIGI